MKLTLTEAGLDDFRSIRAYTLETWGEEQEKIYLRKIWNRIQSLREDPLRYHLREELFPGVSKMLSCSITPTHKAHRYTRPSRRGASHLAGRDL